MFTDSDWDVKSIVEALADDVFRAVVAARQSEMLALGSGYQDSVQVDEKARTITVPRALVVSGHPQDWLRAEWL